MAGCLVYTKPFKLGGLMTEINPKVRQAGTKSWRGWHHLHSTDPHQKTLVMERCVGTQKGATSHVKPAWGHL